VHVAEKSPFLCANIGAALWCHEGPPATNPRATASSLLHPLPASPSHTNCLAFLFPEGALSLSLCHSPPSPSHCRPACSAPATLAASTLPGRSCPRHGFLGGHLPAGPGAAARWRGPRQGRGRAGALSCGAHWTPTSPTWALTVRNGALRRRVPSYLNSPCSLSVGRFEETRRLARLGLVIT
jgi:hypothetical protein